MGELSKIIADKKNPYTFEEYTEDELRDMVKSLDYFPYYSEPGEVFSQPELYEENYTKFLNFVVSSLEPYLSIANVKKIRISLFKEIPYLFLNGIYAPQILQNDGPSLYKDQVVERMSSIMVRELRKENIALSLVAQCFNQVINDDMMCDKILEILGTDKNDKDTILTIYSVPLGFVEHFFDSEKWGEVVGLLTENGQDFRETWIYLSDKIIKG
jgi:hypothetical protein